MSEEKWFEGRVPLSEYKTLPTVSGVYAIVDVSLRSVYVGVATSIRTRIGSHIQSAKLGKGVPGVLRAWRTFGLEGLRVCVLEHAPRALLQDRENYWLETLRPDHELLNSQSQSNYVTNYERKQERGVTYLKYNISRPLARPFMGRERVNGRGDVGGWGRENGTGDVFASLFDGITTGGSRSIKGYTAVAIERYGLDGELSFCATLSKTGTPTFYSTPLEMLSAFLVHRNQGSELLFRNLDYNMERLRPALEHLTNQGYEVETIVDGYECAVFVKIRKHKQAWCLRDIHALLPISIDDLATLTSTEKLDSPYSSYSRYYFGRAEHFNPENSKHLSYLRRDLEIILTIYDSYSSTLMECYCISPSYSAGSTALKAFRYIVTKQTQRPEVNKYILNAYFGGLLFLIWVRAHPDLFKVDLKAADMTAILWEINNGASGCRTDEEEPSRPGIYLCEVSGPEDLPLPFVTARSTYGTIWHTSSVRTYLCNHTIALARTLGYTIQVVDGLFF